MGMRVAIVSDIHGNRTALEAVLSDLRATSPDLILHGGDLAEGGADPAYIVDRVRDLGWAGVVGNADEMLFDPESLEDFANSLPPMPSLPLAGMFDTIREMAATTRETLGDRRLAWLKQLPRKQIHGSLALVHASPGSTWRAPAYGASEGELKSVYEQLGQPNVAYGHIHHPYIRNVSGMMIANTGSVSLSYDGDRRASYLLLDGSVATIRRVEYDVDRELKALSSSGVPHADWIARILITAAPQMP